MDILNRIKEDTLNIKGRPTNQFRVIAKSYKKELDHYTISEIYAICESLLEHKKRAETIIAYQIVFDQKKKFTNDTFHMFEEWLFKYIQDWWDCDDFMTHAFQYVISLYPENISKIFSWIDHEKFAVRRSAAVILIRPVQRGFIQEHLIFQVCDLLMNDSHHLVQKGYGWLLKESSAYYHDALVRYLKEHVKDMSRTAFRYAIEKLALEERTQLMKLQS